MNSLLEKWLQALNGKFRDQGIEVGQRPFLAFIQYGQDFKIQGLDFGSEEAKAIFNWYKENTQPEAHQMGSLFTSVFYYDTCFWPVDVFNAYGTISLEGLLSLRDMPESVKDAMRADPEQLRRYRSTWINSVDYAYGFSDMQATLPTTSDDDRYARKLLKNADHKLRAAISQMLEPHPNTEAAMSCRMATEIFLKVFLVIIAKLSDEQIRKFGHKLQKLLAKIRELYPEHELLTIESKIEIFPKISDRYTGADLSPTVL
jgi:hypothetical protein